MNVLTMGSNNCLGELLRICIQRCQGTCTHQTKEVALRWIQTLLPLSGRHVLPHLHDLVAAVLACISGDQIAKLAAEVGHSIQLDLAEHLKYSTHTDPKAAIESDDVEGYKAFVEQVAARVNDEMSVLNGSAVQNVSQ
eukprot:gene16386-5001_t